VPDNVADGEPRRPVRQREDVVEVAAHLGAAVAREVGAGKFEAGDLGQLRQQTLLQHLRDAVLPFVKAGVVDDKGRPAPQISGEAQVLGRVDPPGRPGHQGDAAEHPAASGQRNVHGRADTQGVAQRQQLRIVHVRTRRPGGRVGVETGRLPGQDPHDGGLGGQRIRLKSREAAEHVLQAIAVQHRYLDRPAVLIGQIDDQPVGEAWDGKMSEALQGPGDIEACGQVTGRLGQQDGPGFSGLRIGEGGLCLGEQRSLLVSVGLDGQPGSKTRESPVASAERTQGDRARQQATVTVAHSCPDFVRHPRKHRLPQPLRPRRIGSPGQRVQAGSHHLGRVIARHLPECAVSPHGDELAIRRPENKGREGTVL
jgi:hypothetical protein